MLTFDPPILLGSANIRGLKHNTSRSKIIKQTIKFSLVVTLDDLNSLRKLTINHSNKSHKHAKNLRPYQPINKSKQPRKNHQQQLRNKERHTKKHVDMGPTNHNEFSKKYGKFCCHLKGNLSWGCLAYIQTSQTVSK